MRLKTLQAYENKIHQLTVLPFALTILRAAIRAVPLSKVFAQIKKDYADQPELRERLLDRAAIVMRDFSTLTKGVKP